MAPHPLDPLPPRVRPLAAGDPDEVDGHRLVGRLGGGGMGVVYAAVAPSGEAVALKVARAEWAADAAPDRSAAPVRHDQSVCAVGADAGGLLHGRPWTAVRYLPGPDLGQYVRETGPLPEPALLALAAGTAEALAFIHAAGVPHGDVRPGNVVVTPDGPRLVDHGIARRIDDGDSRTTAGSPGWLAPERYAGSRPGAASDVFSWACLVALAATGREPLAADASAQETARQAREDGVDLTGVPEGLRAVLARALSADPASRPPAEDVYLECLLLSGVEDSTTRDMWAERLLALVRANWPHVDVAPYRPSEWAGAASGAGEAEGAQETEGVREAGRAQGTGSAREAGERPTGTGRPPVGAGRATAGRVRGHRRGTRVGRILALVVVAVVLLAAAVGGGYLLLGALADEPEAVTAGSESGSVPGSPEGDAGPGQEEEPGEPGAEPLAGMELVSASLDTLMAAESFELTLVTYAGNGGGYGQPLPTATTTLFDHVLYRSGPREALRWTSTVTGARTSDLLMVDGDLLRAANTAWNGVPSWYRAEAGLPGPAEAFTPEGVVQPLVRAVESGTVLHQEEVVFTPPPPVADAYGHLGGEAPDDVPAVRVEGEFSASGAPDGADTVFTLVATEDGVPLGFATEGGGSGGAVLNGRPVSEGVPVSFLDPAAPEPERWYTRYTFVELNGEPDLGVPAPAQVQPAEALPAEALPSSAG
ncbi:MULTISPECIES: serine/threonine-protein kinase [Nocardiopsis]|uniref:Protein kinase domain-containing protein n=1 Tax=Nocardiopsis sinuspersici TaxID=501010 RepID=A0A1V3BXA0_9ACTN|nr:MULTISPECIES: protein kinase [Nocardiopsis]OOC52869.1 hypothetical protein NOSIN_02710 [Nocardiopsis sinuspersici]